MHKIAILDIRLFNLDRNVSEQAAARCRHASALTPSRQDANLLVQRVARREKVPEDGRPVTSPSDTLYYAKKRWNRADPTWRLVPIDHSYSLPDTLEVGWADWVWLEWPQVRLRRSCSAVWRCAHTIGSCRSTSP